MRWCVPQMDREHDALVRAPDGRNLPPAPVVLRTRHRVRRVVGDRRPHAPEAVEAVAHARGSRHLPCIVKTPRVEMLGRAGARPSRFGRNKLRPSRESPLWDWRVARRRRAVALYRERHRPKLHGSRRPKVVQTEVEGHGTLGDREIAHAVRPVVRALEAEHVRPTAHHLAVLAVERHWDASVHPPGVLPRNEIRRLHPRAQRQDTPLGFEGHAEALALSGREGHFLLRGEHHRTSRGCGRRARRGQRGEQKNNACMIFHAGIIAQSGRAVNAPAALDQTRLLWTSRSYLSTSAIHVSFAGSFARAQNSSHTAAKG